MNWKEFFSDYFHFTRKERIAAIVIVFLIFLIWLSPTVHRLIQSRRDSADKTWLVAAKQLETKKAELKTTVENHDLDEMIAPKKIAAHSPGLLFDFDPNVASDEEWTKLGLREKTIRIIKNFLDHGGRFKKPGDLKKIYGLSPGEFARLEPYIKIKNFIPNNPVQNSGEKIYHEKTVSKIFIDINSTDTTAFISLPGIGNKLATRIVNFREKLGGFYSIDQVGETYGLSDSTFQKIKSFLTVDKINLKKININTATKDELKVHPYLKWIFANAIVEYRNQHGNFSSVDDLKKISAITDEIFEKVKLYLTVN
jgi:competence ComEA-like helix-hairpin-helix protein